MRSQWVGFVLAGFALFVAARADAGAIYKFRSTTATGLGPGQIELTFENTKVSGQLRPHSETDNRAVPITGSNPADGVLELTFHLDQAKTWTFNKSLNGNNITWDSTGGEDVRFWRPRYGDFSDAALTLDRAGDCGPIYRTLKVWFAEGTLKDRLSSFLSGNRVLAELPVTIWAAMHSGADASSKRRRLSLAAALQELLGRDDRDLRDFDVPVGTEITVATALNRSGFMTVNLSDSGGCGGSDESFFAFDRSFLFEGSRFLKDRFVAFIDENLKAFAGKDRRGQTWDQAIEKGVVSTLNIAPFTSAYRVKMRVASEVSRQVPGRWDSFDVSFEPAELIVNIRSEYSVVVTVDNLQSTDRSTGRKVRFKDLDAGQAMAEIETALLVSLSRRIKGGWCRYLAEGIDETKVRCDGRRPPRGAP